MQWGQWAAKKQVLVGALGVMALCVVAGGAYYTWLITPLPVPETAEEAMETIGSARYQRLPEYRQNEYLEHTRRVMDEISDDERADLLSKARTDDAVRQSLRQVRRQEMVHRAIDYAAIESAEARTQMLDEVIDGWGQRRRQRPQGARGRPDGAPRDAQRRRGPRRERIQEQFEHGNPQANALIGEFFRALRLRREERGMSRR